MIQGAARSWHSEKILAGWWRSHGKELITARGLTIRCFILGIAIRPPTVAEGTSRLRFAMTSAHSDGDIQALAALIPEIAP